MKKVLTLFLFCFLFQQVNSAENEIYKKIDLFGEVLEKINKEYVDEINQSESMDSAINGLLQSLTLTRHTCLQKYLMKCRLRPVVNLVVLVLR